MRFVWAVVAFIVAAGLVGVGVAQRTVFLGPDSETFTVESEEDLPFTVIDSDVFEALPDALPGEKGTLQIESEGDIFATYARTDDMLAWLSDQRFTHATADGGDIETATVEPTAEIEGEPEGRSPVGSDLWLEEFTDTGSMQEQFSFPDDSDFSVLIASDGTKPAPEKITVTWPIDNSTPSAPWFIGAGIGVLILGIGLYIWAMIHSRRSRGPRRKGKPVPLTGPVAIARDRHASSPEPIEQGEQDEAEDAPVGEDADAPRGDDETPREDGTTKRVARRRTARRLRIIVPAVGLTAALVAGCAPDESGTSASPEPSASETAEESEVQQAPAVTETQAARIIAKVSKVVADADKKHDADRAAERLSGVALEMRKVNYDLSKKVKDYASLPAIPEEPIRVLLPQAFDGWPRSVLAVVEDSSDETVAPTILTLTQKDPWSSYKASYVSQLRPSAEIPDLAPSYQGAALVPPDSSFLQVAPSDVAAAYADVLKSGGKSSYADLFDLENDGFLKEVREKRKATLANFNKTGEKTGKLSFGQAAGKVEPFSLMTLHSGAIVGVTVLEEEVVKPTNDDALIRFEDDAVLKAFTGEDSSADGVRTRYLDQLFFYVPAKGSDESIRLLASSSSIRGAELLGESSDE